MSGAVAGKASSRRSWSTIGLIGVVAAASACIVGSDLLRAVRNYSPVPWNDMWPGYLGFLRRVSEGDASAWWYQHNEHRIVLSRVLYWIDFHGFDGQLAFLIAVNVLLVIASIVTITAFLSRADARMVSGPPRAIAILLIVSWLFLGMQYSNLDYAFQSQFFLAHWLPLAALFCLSRAPTSTRTSSWFVLACALGIASAGTMANGVLALPLMTAFAILARLGRRRIAILSLLSAVTLVAYFADYRSPSYHGSLVDELTHRPVDVALFTLRFLGSPFLYLWPWPGRVGGTLASGLVFVGLFAIAAVAWYRGRPRRPDRLALLLYCIYLIASGVAIAGGRLMFGSEAAWSPRYTTSALMGWVALVLLHLTPLVDRVGRHRLVAVCVLVALETAMLSLQWRSRDRFDYDPADQELVGLALTLGVRDLGQIRSTFSFLREIDADTQWARLAKRSFFLAKPLDHVADGVLVEIVPADGRPRCTGRVDEVHRLDGDTRFVRVDGLLSMHAGFGRPVLVRLLDRRREVIGVATTSPRSPSWLSVAGRRVADTNFAGYLRSADLPNVVTARVDEPACEIDFELPGVLPAVPREPFSD